MSEENPSSKKKPEENPSPGKANNAPEENKGSKKKEGI